jgi:hypothetical protein
LILLPLTGYQVGRDRWAMLSDFPARRDCLGGDRGGDERVNIYDIGG